ncbi:MAG: hypothetical protein ACI9LG_000139 [Moritella dasanensis]|jgi:hypothetical protein
MTLEGDDGTLSIIPKLLQDAISAKRIKVAWVYVLSTLNKCWKQNKRQYAACWIIYHFICVNRRLREKIMSKELN